MNYLEQIKTARQAQGITQLEMAKALETTQQQYSKYEKGIQEMPVRQFAKICRKLNVSADEILGLSSISKP